MQNKEMVWKQFKKIIVKTTKDICGKKKVRTKWWNQTVERRGTQKRKGIEKNTVTKQRKIE